MYIYIYMYVYILPFLAPPPTSDFGSIALWGTRGGVAATCLHV